MPLERAAEAFARWISGAPALFSGCVAVCGRTAAPGGHHARAPRSLERMVGVAVVSIEVKAELKWPLVMRKLRSV